MSILISCLMLEMVLLLVYMAYRLLAKKDLVTLLAVCFQIFTLSITLFNLAGNVSVAKDNAFQMLYFTFGILMPCLFLVHDYYKMLNNIRESSAFTGFLGRKERAPRTLENTETQKKYINPIIEEKPVSELTKELGLYKDNIMENVAAGLSRAQTYIDSMDYDSAYEIYARILEFINGSPILYFNYANLCYRREDYGEAVRNYKKVLELYEGISKGEDRKVSILHINDKRIIPPNRHGDKGEKEIRYDEYMVFYNLGNAQFKIGRYEQAVYSFKKALEINPGLEEAFENIARALIAQGRKNEALDYYRKITENTRSSYKTHFSTARLYLETSQFSEAVKELEECIRLNPSFLEAYECLGEAFARDGRHSDAIAEYQKLAKLKPNDYRIFYNMGTSYYHLNMKDEAVKCFERVIKIKPDSYRSYYNMAIALDELGRYESAISAFRKVIELKGDFVDAYKNLGVLLATQRRYPEALDVYTKGLSRNPEEYSLYFNMGISLSETGRYAEAVEAYKNALELKPDEFEISCHLGVAYTHLRRYSDAIEVYKNALKLKPSESEIFFNLSVVYSLLKKFDIAIDNLRRAIELNSELKNEAKCNRAFDSLRLKAEFRELVS